MTILQEKREVHFCNPSIEELCHGVEIIRNNPKYDDFKIMIDGFDENTIIEGGLCLSE